MTYEPYPWDDLKMSDFGLFDHDRHRKWKSDDEWEVRPDPGPGLWSPKDGRTMRIRDMETSHIVNTIAYIWRSTTMHRHGVPGPGLAIPSDRARAKIDEMMDVLRARLS